MKPNTWASLTFSAIGLALMLTHIVKSSGQVNVLDAVLLVIAFFPWLWTIFKTIKFGGAEFEFRDVIERQARQQEEIRALQFLVANFLTERQHEYLRKFADAGPVEVEDDGSAPRLFEVIGDLRRLGFLKAQGDWNEAAAVNWSGDFKTLFGITELGREYIDLRAKAKSAV